MQNHKLAEKLLGKEIVEKLKTQMEKALNAN